MTAANSSPWRMAARKRHQTGKRNSDNREGGEVLSLVERRDFKVETAWCVRWMGSEASEEQEASCEEHEASAGARGNDCEFFEDFEWLMTAVWEDCIISSSCRSCVRLLAWLGRLCSGSDGLCWKKSVASWENRY